MIYIGENEIPGIYLGSEEIPGIYVGEELIYPMTVTAWSVSPTEISMPREGGTEKIKIAAMDDWAISSSESWITFSQNSGQSGRTNVFATIAENVGLSRTATITVADTGNTTALTISVSQEALAFSVSPSALTASKSAETINLTIASPLAWTATSSESWAVLSTGSGLNGITTITVSVPDYAGDSARTATITVENGTDTSAITMTQKVSALPEKAFLINYNAKNYDPATYTISKTSGQTFNQDLVLNAAAASYDTDHITVNGQGFSYRFNNAAANPFNRSNTDCLTVIIKAKPSTLTSGAHSILSNRGGSYNWMVFNPANGSPAGMFFLHTADGNYNNVPSVQALDLNAPNIFAFRVSNGTGYGQSYTDNTTSATKSITWGGTTDYVHFLTGVSSAEYWVGDFYWIYISTDALTDAEIQQVIDYNEEME